MSKRLGLQWWCQRRVCTLTWWFDGPIGWGGRDGGGMEGFGEVGLEERQFWGDEYIG